MKNDLEKERNNPWDFTEATNMTELYRLSFLSETYHECCGWLLLSFSASTVWSGLLLRN